MVETRTTVVGQPYVLTREPHFGCVITWMGTKLRFHLSSGKLSGYRVYLRNASITKYISLSILHCRALGRFLHTPSPLASTLEGVFLVSSQPPNTHHPTPLLSVPLSSRQQKSSESLSKTKVTLVTSSAKKVQWPSISMDHGLHGLCKNPPCRFLQQSAPSLSDRDSFNARHTCVGASS
jgi:hypothetical protein